MRDAGHRFRRSSKGVVALAALMLLGYGRGEDKEHALAVSFVDLQNVLPRVPA